MKWEGGEKEERWCLSTKQRIDFPKAYIKQHMAKNSHLFQVRSQIGRALHIPDSKSICHPVAMATSILEQMWRDVLGVRWGRKGSGQSVSRYGVGFSAPPFSYFPAL
jgi:hypothetical protein